MAFRTPIEKLRSLLSYDPETGVLTWKDRPKSRGIRTKAGDIAGTKQVHGYIAINIDRMPQLAHRIAWAMMTGEWPKHQVDHINMDRSDNRWENLREATNSQNGMNRTAQSNNRGSGVKGVTKHKQGKGYCARIMANGVEHYLGYFQTIAEAKSAYEAAAKKLHEGYHRT